MFFFFFTTTYVLNKKYKYHNKIVLNSTHLNSNLFKYLIFFFKIFAPKNIKHPNHLAFVDVDNWNNLNFKLYMKKSNFMGLFPNLYYYLSCNAFWWF